MIWQLLAAGALAWSLTFLIFGSNIKSRAFGGFTLILTVYGLLA